MKVLSSPFLHFRPKPEERKPAYMDDPRGRKLDQLPDDFPKQQKKYGTHWGPF